MERIQARGFAVYDLRTGEMRTEDVVFIRPGDVIQMEDGAEIDPAIKALSHTAPGLSASGRVHRLSRVARAVPPSPPSTVAAAPQATEHDLELIKSGKVADLRARLAELLEVSA